MGGGAGERFGESFSTVRDPAWSGAMAEIPCGSRGFASVPGALPEALVRVVRSLSRHRFITSTRIERGGIAGHDVVDTGDDGLRREVLATPKSRRDAEAYLETVRGRFVRETLELLRPHLAVAA